MLKILFICLGNICRSPLAHGILLDYVNKHGYGSKILVNSAGTSAFHVGSHPDIRSINIAKKHNITLKHQARQLIANDLEEYDYILVMDHLNYEDVLSMVQTNEQRTKILMLRSFDAYANGVFNVPDPYYGVESDFEEVFAICKRSIDGFIEFLKVQNQLPPD